MSHQDLKPLLAFAAVLEHGSMHAAAAALGMTPSAVSQHIARLERLHQVKLLHRSTRRLSPTDAGRVLGVHCLRLRATLADTHTALQQLKTEVAGDLHLALTSGMADAPALQAALHALAADYPRLRPVLHFSDALADLRAGGIDIALRGGDTALDAPDLVARPLAAWRWRICASPAYLAQHPPIERPEQLPGHRWVGREPPRITLTRGADTQVLQAPLHCQADQLAAVRSLALAGLGLSLQVEGDVRGWLRQGRLQVVLPDWALPVVQLFAVTPQRAQSAKVRTALQVLQNSFANEEMPETPELLSKK